ncbi:MAG TPA: amino acid permease [Candidatus Marinimicrobia bacterium]|jgi:amino acid transporter|nr:amino acid permease [Candidatus Neomarinimicrobiota bacterium]MDP7716219.1 amino acid permease [Candidatus Neomarinimicrobiota bacterium]HJL84649.1 amino acid permease [Candidatus Neomarinimicrobiota bacterium]HJM85691.1 amino acid permease [Candidatus Neomarinimicrobiota bacterium]
MAVSDSVQDEGLVRVIGTGALGLSVVNMVVGAGIFVMPGLVAAVIGPAAILAYLICSVTVALVFLCFAEVGSRVSRSGGAYAYVEEAFGPFVGFIASILFWFGFSALADAAITVIMVDSIAIVVPILGESIPRAVFIIALLTFLATVNIRGVKAGVRLYIFNTLAKLVPLLLLVGAGLFVINIDYLAIPEWPSAASIGASTILLFYAFNGAESALNASGEIQNPSKTVPLGLLLGLGGILLLYVGLQTVAQGVLGPELANDTEAPLVAVATAVFGDWGGKMLIAGVVISIYSNLSGDMLGGPRVVFASSLDNNLPRFLGKVHPKYKTPHIAIVFFAVVIGVFALSGTFKYLAVVATGSLLLVDLGVILAVLRLRQRDGLPKDGEFRLPFGPVIPLLSCAIVGWLLLQVPLNEAATIVTLVGACAVIYAIRSVFLGAWKTTAKSVEPHPRKVIE